MLSIFLVSFILTLGGFFFYLFCMKALCIIPARYGSTRFKGKVLALLWGKPIIQHVYERASRAKSISEVWVATDHKKVYDTVQAFGGKAIMTSARHQSGTDRIAEAITKIKGDIIINVQGDEPLIAPTIIDRLGRYLLANPSVQMGTLATGITDKKELANPNVVKVVCDKHGTALYFSRWPIPFLRDQANTKNVHYYKHIGIYGYRREFLLGFVKWPVSSLEKAEKLEQLRVLENGYPITVLKVNYRGVGVDTVEDLEKIKRQKSKCKMQN
jgi:3-deoxy-manno-octulosonate cytidylyltransferase (CMP-KDO synthetase)